MAHSDLQTLAAAGRLAGSCVDVIGAAARSVILHGSLATGEFRPGRSDIDLLVVIDGRLSGAQVAALDTLVRRADLGGASGADLHVVTADVAGAPTRTPPLELHVGRYDGSSIGVEVESHIAAAPDLPAELSMARAEGRALIGADPRDVMAPVPPEWIRQRGRHWLTTWLAHTDDAEDAAHMVLTACRIWHFAVEGAHSAKPAAARWALSRDASLTAVRQALHQYAADPAAPIDEAGIATVLDTVLRETAWRPPAPPFVTTTLGTGPGYALRVVTEWDLRLPDGRTLWATDSGGRGPTVVWQHGTPHTGALLAPLLSPAVDRGLRLVSYARPGYGGSTPRPGRDVASAAADVTHVVDALGIDRFAVVGLSGGAPHALACAALLPDRVTAVATLAGLAPYPGDADWFAGMVDDRALRAATAGRAARARYAEIAEFDPATFTDADWAALSGSWAALGEDAGRAAKGASDGEVDDDVAYVSPWGFDPTTVTAPILLVHGDEDRMVPVSHADRLTAAMPHATRWSRPGDGHVSVLAAYPAVLDWLVTQE